MSDRTEQDTNRSHRLSSRGKALLILGLLLHLSLRISWKGGVWNRFTFDSVATQGRRGWDFYALYQAGHNVLTGASIYESDDDKIDLVVPVHTPYRYLPFPAYTLGVLLNALSPLHAFRLWMVIIHLVWLACAYFSWRTAPHRDLGAILVAMWLCFTPFYLEIYLGQFSVVQAALIFVMMYAALRPSLEARAEGGSRRTTTQASQGGVSATPLDWRFDLAWVFSLIWKQNTALFLPLFLHLKRWFALILAGATVLVSSAPYFLRNPSAWQAFSANFYSGLPVPQLGNLGVRQLGFSLTSSLFPSLSPEAHLTLQRLWIAAVLGLGLWLTLRDWRQRVLYQLCFWTTTFFLVYHDVWEHHYVLLVPVYVCLYWQTRSRALLWLYALTAIWTPYILLDPQGLAAFHAPMRWTALQPPVLDVAYHASKALPTLLLWGCIVRLMWPGPKAGEAGRA